MNRKYHSLPVLTAALLLTHIGQIHAQTSTSPAATPIMLVGQNVSGIVDWNPAQPFVDIIKYARSWQTINATNVAGGSWATDLQQYITTDANGWPTQVPFSVPGITNGQPDTNNPGFILYPQQYVHTIVEAQTPGTYRLKFRGVGTFNLGGPGTNNSSWNQTFTPSDITNLPTDENGKYYWDAPQVAFQLDQANVPEGNFFLTINDSTGTNYIRDLELLSPGYTTANTNHPFTPQYINTLRGNNTIRMMSWEGNNGTWTNRTLPSTYSQSVDSGVALEYMVEICNQTGANLWFNIPYQADQTYVSNAAQVIFHGSKADGTPFVPGVDDPSLQAWPGLNPGLKVYVEYSNETWNYSFPQAAYVVAQAVALRSQGLPFDSSDDYTAGEQYTAYQSANIWKWFYEACGGTAPQRIIRVLGGITQTYLSQIRLAAFQIPGLITVKQKPDCLAIAPYFGSDIADNLVSSGQLSTTTVPQVLSAAEADMTNNVLPMVAALNTLANQYGVWLNCYEAGQGLVSTANTDNTNLTALLIAANHDPGMGTLYSQYMTGLANAGVVEMVNFSHIGEPSQYGSWNVLDYLSQPTNTAYKYQALATWITNNPASSDTLPPTITVDYTPSVIDTTGTGMMPVQLSAAGSVDYIGTIPSFGWTINGTNYSGATITPTLPLGVNSITITATNSQGSSSTNSINVTVRPLGSDTVLVQSDFTGTAPGQYAPWTNTSILSSGISFGGVTFIPYNWSPSDGIYAPVGIINGSADDNAFGVYLGGYSERSTLQDALTYNQYLSCTITPNPGQSLDLRGAYVEWTLSNITGNSEQYCALETSLSGFNNSSVLYQSPQYNLSDHWTTPETDTFGTYLPFTDAYANVTGPIEVRIYLYGNTGWYKPADLTEFKMTGALKQSQ